MLASELIEKLKQIPGDTEVFLSGDMGLSRTNIDDANYVEAYDVWVSEYDNNGIPYTYTEIEPVDFTLVRRGRPDYVAKTLRKRMIFLLE